MTKKIIKFVMAVISLSYQSNNFAMSGTVVSHQIVNLDEITIKNSSTDRLQNLLTEYSRPMILLSNFQESKLHYITRRLTELENRYVAVKHIKSELVNRGIQVN